MITLNYKTSGDKEVTEALEKYAKGEQLCINFINYPPAYFEEKFDMETDDINGWDWWGHIDFNGVTIPVFGDSWYGHITMEHPDYDRSKDPDLKKTHEVKYNRFAEKELEDYEDKTLVNVTEYHGVKEDTYFVPQNKGKFYFWRFVRQPYTLVYAHTEQEAIDFIIKLWGQYDDILTIPEFMEKKKWYDENKYVPQEHVTFSGDVYIIGGN